MADDQNPAIFLERKVYDVLERISEGEERVHEYRKLIEAEVAARVKMIEEFRIAQRWHFELSGSYVEVEEPHETIGDAMLHVKQHHMVSNTSVRQRVQDFAMSLKGESFTPKMAFDHIKTIDSDVKSGTMYNTFAKLVEKKILEKTGDGLYRLHPKLAIQGQSKDLGSPSISGPGALDFSASGEDGGGSDD